MKNILYIDDEIETFAFAYYDCLLSLGYNVVAAKNASQALEIIESKSFSEFDLIILDNVMPAGPGNVVNFSDIDFGKKSGVFLYKKIRKKSPSIPIIFLSVVSYNVLQKRYGFKFDFNAGRYLEKGQTTIVGLENETKSLIEKE